MDREFKQFIKQLKGIQLTREEKRASWRALEQELGLTPTITWRWQWQVASVLCSLVVALGVGSGLSQAAQGAVPGDLLYSLKIKVNEPVERLMIKKIDPSPAVQTNFEVELVRRRLDEAEQVLKKEDGQIRDTTKDQLKIQIAEQAVRVIKNEDKKESQQELKQVLEEHKQVIEDLDKKENNRGNNENDWKSVRKSEDKRQNKQDRREDD